MTAVDVRAPKGMTPIREWTAHGLRCVLVRAPIWNAINGYVQVPSITTEQAEQVEVHGGVTFGPTGDDWIGFDTLHSGDYWPEMAHYVQRTSYDRTWTEDEVAAECERMAASAKAVMEL
jgi:hypothetical protein